MSSKPIRLIIADDHPMVREGLKVSLESEGLSVVADVSEVPANHTTDAGRQ